MHWNMRNDHYGFPAIEHRFKALGADPFVLPAQQKLDLSNLMWEMYGDDYVPDISQSGKLGKIICLAEMNKINCKDFLAGQDEANAFFEGEYINLQRSTLLKLEIFCRFIDLAHRGQLKTYAPTAQATRIDRPSIVDRIKAHWIISLIVVGSSILAALAKGWEAIMSFLDN